MSTKINDSKFLVIIGDDAGMRSIKGLLVWKLKLKLKLKILRRSELKIFRYSISEIEFHRYTDYAVYKISISLVSFCFETHGFVTLLLKSVV